MHKQCELEVGDLVKLNMEVIKQGSYYVDEKWRGPEWIFTVRSATSFNDPAYPNDKISYDIRTGGIKVGDFLRKELIKVKC